jgi:hypothetical protein
VEPATDAEATIEWVHRILKEERDIIISSRPLEATAFQVENVRIAYVFYESGLSINVMYTVDGPDKRAVGFKLSDGMEIPLNSRRASNSHGRSRSWPGRSGDPISRSRTTTDGGAGCADHAPCPRRAGRGWLASRVVIPPGRAAERPRPH